MDPNSAAVHHPARDTFHAHGIWTTSWHGGMLRSVDVTISLPAHLAFAVLVLVCTGTLVAVETVYVAVRRLVR